jgi:hypothetical protein
MQFENGLAQRFAYTQPYKLNFGIQLNQVLNGSGHGMLTDVDLIVRAGQGQFAIGTFMQDKPFKFAGLSFQYKYFITSNKFINIYTHYSFMFHYQNCLNDRLNKAFHPQEYSNFCEYEKYNTLTNHIGFGIESMALDNFYVDAKIGIGGYFSSVIGADNRNKSTICREDAGFSFMVSIGVLYRISISKHEKHRAGGYKI